MICEIFEIYASMHATLDITLFYNLNTEDFPGGHRCEEGYIVLCIYYSRYTKFV